ncbi:MAG TPA: thiamine pyrophosphate-dependent enzyme [Iamia sp.]|nr:thiamine pyrophosphate-dependent enzyme [Iamia sp.]
MNEIEELTRAVLRARRFDVVGMALQRQGNVDTYGQAYGQEVGQIGAAFDLEPDDMVFPSYRQPGVGLLRGVTPLELLTYYSGSNFAPWDWKAKGYGPYTIPVGSQTAHATGWAWASRLRGESNVTMVFFGDGAASQGEVHEAMNYAGVFKAPVVFVCENNGWAISMPSARQTAAEGVFKRAEAYGFPGVRVQGNDIWAVREASQAAVARARAGEGPSLIEIMTYRIGAHTTSDDPTLYRSKDEVKEQKAQDAMQTFLADATENHGLEQSVLEKLETEVEDEFDTVVETFVATREARR